MFIREQVVNSIKIHYQRYGNGEPVSNETLNQWVDEVCSPEFKQVTHDDLGDGTTYQDDIEVKVGEWHWGKSVLCLITEDCAEALFEGTYFDNSVPQCFEVVSFTTKWHLIHGKLKALNNLKIHEVA